MNFTKTLLATLTVALLANAAFAAETLPLPAGLIPLQSAEGTRLLETSGARANFYALIQHMNSQQKLSYCGVASAVTVLNTLHPTNTPLCDTLDGKVAYFDQVNFFSKAVEQVVAQSVVLKQGFTLQEWSRAVATYGVKTEAWHCGSAEGQADYTNFLARAKAALQNTNQLLVINFSRKSLGQAGTGHFSPIGAYYEQVNKFLVLDVALFKYPAFWVDGKALWDSLATVDSVSKKNRGFVVITSDSK